MTEGSIARERPSRGRQAASEEKRRLIIDAAVRVFARDGYHTSRVGDIAEEAGVAHGLLYHYFSSKDEVLATLFRENWSELLGRFAKVEQSDEPADEQLRGIAKILLRTWRNDPDLVRVMVREVARSSHLQEQVDEIGMGFATIQRVIERGQAQGVFRPDLDPRLASWIFYGGLEEILTGWVLGTLPDGDEEVARAERTIIDVVCGGLTVRDGACEYPSSAGTIVKLGVGAFGLAWSLTTTAAYLPPVLGEYTGSTSLIGAVLAAEGVFALTLPLVIGPWSDTFHTPLGRRRPFMLVAIGPIGFCLALMAFMPNLWTTALLVFAFFFAYYVYEPPYRGLYPDLLPESVYGRAQGVQHLFRGIALGGGLILGGILFHLWQPAPFLVAAGIVSAACLVPVLFLREDGGHGRVFEGVGTYVRHSWRVLRRNPDVGRFLLANAAWEGTFAGARTFVVLYITVGLGEPLSTSTLVLAAVAAGYVIAALVSGPVGDRFGLARVITWCSLVYGLALLGGGLATQWHAWYLAIIFVVALFAGAVMTLAWGLLFKLMPADDRGAIAGLATTTKGIGLIFGTLLAGILIDVLQPYLPGTDGYQVLWPILGVPILLAVPLVFSLIGPEQRSGQDPGFTAGS